LPFSQVTLQKRHFILMNITTATTSAENVTADAIIVGVLKGGRGDALEGPAVALDAALGGALTTMRQEGEVAGGANETTIVHTLAKLSAARVVLVGLGPRAGFGVERVRLAAAAGCRAARKAGARHVALALWWAEMAQLGLDETSAAQAAAEGVLFGLYEFK